MSTPSPLKELKDAETLSEFAKVLDLVPSWLSFQLYKNPQSKYKALEVKKRIGGYRSIHAPNEKLKSIQKRLLSLLEDCLRDIRESRYGGTKPKLFLDLTSNIQSKKVPNKLNFYPAYSHGFEKFRSPLTNAWAHRNKRWVINFDIQDFFPSINLDVSEASSAPTRIGP